MLRKYGKKWYIMFRGLDGKLKTPSLKTDRQGRRRKMSRRFFAFFCIALNADINIVPPEKLCITTADT